MDSPRKRAVDIRAVAERAGVSIATVSRVMNQVATVDARLAARVIEAAGDLNYTPNTQARALVSGRSGLIGLIVSEITNPFFPELIQAFEAAAVERGFELLIGSTSYSPERMTQCVRRMVERKVEGVAVMTFGMEEGLLQELTSRGIPVVSVASTHRLENAVSIEVDYRQGIRGAVEHLTALGHEDIAFISGPMRVRTACIRREAFVASMEEFGLSAPDASIIEGDHTMEGGQTAALQLFDRAQLPTAIVCSNDMTAIGVLHAASSRGIKVPEDISIIGFDDIHMARFTVPPLTSVRMAGADIAAAACNALPLDRNAAPGSGNRESLPVPTQLIVRQTSGPVRRGSLHAAETK